MPRTFMDSILQRPSQRYAPEPIVPAAPSASASSSKGGSGSKKWSGPTDLPNRPSGPSSLRAYHPPPSSSANSNRPSRTYASGAPPPAPSSVADSQGTTRSRFGRKKKTHVRNTSESSYGTAPMDDRASNAGSNATYTKKRWWETGSLKGFGKGSRSRAGSVAGESVFSDVEPEGQNGGLASLQHRQYGSLPTRRGTRSDFGAPTSYSSKAPPLPQHDPAMLKAMSNGGRLQSGVAPLGQQPPTLRRNVSSSGSVGSNRHSTLGLPGSTSAAPQGSGGARRASSAVGSSSASDSGWDDFTKQMAKRDIARSWSRGPGSATSSTPAQTQRSTVLNRVQKELQQDAQFEQIARDPGVIRGDLLARATSVVGGIAPSVVEESLVPELPANLRPGSIVGMTSVMPSEASRSTSPVPLPLVRARSPPPQFRAMSPPPQARAMSPPPQTRALSPPPQARVPLPAQAQEQGHTAPAPAPSQPPAQQVEPSPAPQEMQSMPAQMQSAQASKAVDPVASQQSTQQRLPPLHQTSSQEPASDSSSSYSEEDEAEGHASSSEDDRPQTLGVLAEEEEDGSSDGGHEMRPGPRSTYLPRSPVRQTASGSSQSPTKYVPFAASAQRGAPHAGGLGSGSNGGFAGVGARPSTAAVVMQGNTPAPALPAVPAAEQTRMPEQRSQPEAQPEPPMRSREEETEAVRASTVDATPAPAPRGEATSASANIAAPPFDATRWHAPSSVAAAASPQTAIATETPTERSQAPSSATAAAAAGAAAPALAFLWSTSEKTQTAAKTETVAPVTESSKTPTTPPKSEPSPATSPASNMPRPQLPTRTSSVSQPMKAPQTPPLSSSQSEAFTLAPSSPTTPSRYNGSAPMLGRAMASNQAGESAADETASSSSSSDSGDLSREVDNDSGKDGETSSVRTAQAVKEPREDSPKGVKFEGDAVKGDDSSDESVEDLADSITTPGRRSAQGKARELDGQADSASIADSDRTAEQSTRRPLARRLSSSGSMANSFAFSHFMGSKITGKSSSRRIKLGEDDSDSDGNASGDDEELKKRALVEQNRLRNMSVGDDFFGPSLGEVLLAIDNMDFTTETVGKTAALEEEAMAQGVSLEDTTRAQLQAQQIVSEVRRRRAAGDVDADHKTVQSDAGGLAASFAALWLGKPLNEKEAVPASEPAKRDVPTSVSAITDSPANWGGRSSISATPTKSSTSATPTKSTTSATPTKNAKGSQSVLDRPRFRPSRFKQIGSVDIPLGKLPAEELRAPVEERSNVESFYSTGATSNPSSPAPAKKSIDLGDQQRSKDKPAPAKSALKLRPAKSLADTLFSFPTKSPEKKQARAAQKEEKERARRDSLNEKAARKAARREEKEAKGAAVKTVPASPSGKNNEVAEEKAPAETEASLASPTPSLVKTQGEPDAQQQSSFSRQSHESNPTGQSTDEVTKFVTEVPASQEAEVPSSQEPDIPSAPLPAATFEDHTADEPAQSYNGDGADGSDAVAAPQEDFVSPVETREVESAAHPALHFPAQSAPLSEPQPESQYEQQYEPQYQPQPEAQPGSQYEPQYEPQPEPQFGMNIIPPTPPVISGADGSNYMSYGPNTNLARSVSSVSAVSSATAVPSRRKGSILQAAEAYGFTLPPGLTAETIAASSDAKDKRTPSPRRSASPRRSTSSDGGHSSSRRGSHADQPPVPAIPRDLQQPPVPPKDNGSPRQQSPLRLPNNASLSSISPPPSTGSWAGSAAASSVGADDSPARSGGSGDSSGGNAGRSDMYGVSNMAASEVSDNRRQPARVRTQSSNTQLKRGPHLMTSINEWESASPVNGYGGSGYTTPAQMSSPVDAMSPTSRSTGSFRNDDSASIGRNAPYGSSTETYLHPPVPRSRMTADEKKRLAFEAHVSGSERVYAASEGGHGGGGGSEYGGSRYGTANGGSVDGHGAPRGSSRPMSVMSGFTAASIPMSLASLPTAPTSRSVYRPQDPIKAASSSTVDDRLYSRTTMATISVSSGAFATKRGSKSRSGSTSRPSADGPVQSSADAVPEHLQDELGLTVLSLSAHTPPPRKIGSHQILVQIITVALDEMDRMLLRDKVRSDSAYGWVPGRSFCGRVMEVGWEVKRLRKGDMVFGLQSNRKCGALAEFMIIDQDFVAKAPEDCLTVEQIAALPATGVLTYQIVQNHCVHLPKGARILILNAHDGIGLLTMQECASLGLIMVAQCPASISDGLAVCEANGAHEVVVGEPLWAMNSLHESSFDLVIDTIGGRRLYDASRRILASDGQFVTCFGDEHTSANPNFRSHMRSLRRTFFKKDKKNIRYEWTGLENSEDCKEALENVRAVAESGDICPRLRSILPFEDAPRAFDPVTRGGIEEEPGAVVVRVS